MPLKLSEAIRLGAMLGPQSYTSLQRERRKYIFFGPVVKEFCALGAAFAATGAKQEDRVYESDGQSEGGYRGKAYTYKAGEKYRPLISQFDDFLWIRVSCPQCGEVANKPLHRVIPHLNDHHKWTREAIAIWVESIEHMIERAQEPTSQPASRDWIGSVKS